MFHTTLTEEATIPEGMPENGPGKAGTRTEHMEVPTAAEKRRNINASSVLRAVTWRLIDSHRPVFRDEILDLLKIAAHDLRGGLFNVGAGLKLLGRGYYGQMDQGVAEETHKLAGHVTSLMGNLEDCLGRAFSLGEGLETAMEELHLKRDVLDPVLSELSNQLAQSCAMFHNALDAAPVEQLLINGDRFWLKAVFRNLLRNALKYGGKKVRLAIGYKDLNNRIMLNIYNSGEPIPEESRSRLFTKFNRVSPGERGMEQGLGLGLYLVKRAIEKQGGEIWYEAKRNGSNFVFTLPRKTSQVFTS
ncbi:MAG: HAMP domain-containing histidine kinase [Deltaproteobacteria bacterium]|nr:HAMP domain-containing histidine kinase [Deltaproteobacteria bacterium]